MSQILTATGNGFNSGLLAADDKRAMGEEFRQDIELVDFGPAVGDYRTNWWPGGNSFLGESGADVGIQETEGSWGFPDLTRGHNTRFGFIGITRDASGSPLANVTVSLFRTTGTVNGLVGPEFVMSTTSDASGNYAVYSPYYPDAHFINTFKAGSPNVFGTSDTNLIGR